MTLSPDFTNLKKAKLNEICLSIDLETTNTHGAGILSMGVVPFSVETGQIFTEAAFYLRADFRDVVNTASKHGDIGDTMFWWMQQSDEARKEVLGFSGKTPKGDDVFAKLCSQRELMEQAVAYMHSVNECLNTNGRLRPLGNSDLFDVGIFEDTVRAVGLKIEDLPYNFWNTIDLRTAVYLASMCKGKNIKKARARTGTHHNALDDALMQAKWFLDSAQALMV